MDTGYTTSDVKLAQRGEAAGPGAPPAKETLAAALGHAHEGEGHEPGVESTRPPAAPEPASTPQGEADVRTLIGIMKGCKTCMLTSHGEFGLHSRPMALAGVDWPGSHGPSEAVEGRTGGVHATEGPIMWFVTEKACSKCEEVSKNSEVVLSFSNDTGGGAWASVTGHAEVVLSPGAKAKEVWSPMYNAWFPGGPDSPSVCLLKVTPCCATYWQGSHANRLHIAFAALRGKLTGKGINQGKTQEQKSIVFACGSPHAGGSTGAATAGVGGSAGAATVAAQ